MDAIYATLGERIVAAARTAAANHMHQLMTDHVIRQGSSIGGTDSRRVMEDAAMSDALVDDRPAGPHPHVEGQALRHPCRAGRSPRLFRRLRGD